MGQMARLSSSDYLFQSRIVSSQHISARQYNRIFHELSERLGLYETLYNTNSTHRTNPYLINKKNEESTGDLITLCHKKRESTVRCPGIEVDDALEISESIEV